jgi:hypothetical protein
MGFGGWGTVPADIADAPDDTELVDGLHYHSHVGRCLFCIGEEGAVKHGAELKPSRTLQEVLGRCPDPASQDCEQASNGKQR